ncbi:U3 small nucleolar ribonucleo protein IMP4 [Nadsonia fulvescens var. elongata DSM 6958]|uniref:U3 small nucleolar ribonucleoprotein protein IMP4 n=1 Tax=Nadsonia fulvescens var. elongata DSM 6958 TaxID=857566 RepID=A0A1E3PNV0_9ASCO|nr:U3 small nucleolar ribonucleo protein IMP4 [Nadsonia fulvescens var. elongata DSM 6958]
MIRRQARERREYLYTKQLQLQEASLATKRQQLRAALASGKPLPKEVADDEEVRKDFKFDESMKEEIDDEYSALSGIQDPKVVVTTSRDPSSRLGQFAKEVRLLFPTGIRLNRGGTVLPNLVSACNASSTTDLILLHEHRGVPTALTVSHFPHGPTASFSLHNVVLRHDIDKNGNQSEAYPHLIFENFTTPLGKRVASILKHLFPPGAKKDSSRVITFSNNQDFISVRQHVYVRTRDNAELAEVGPRFEMRLFELKLGTVDNKDADIEWRLRGFVRTANKKNYL